MSSETVPDLEHGLTRCYRLDRSIAREGYRMFFEGLEVATGRLPTKRHVSPRELAEGIVDYAIDQYGLLAGDVLESLGLRDAGALERGLRVLVGEGLLKAGERDFWPGQFDGYRISAVDEAAKMWLGQQAESGNLRVHPSE